MIDWPSFLSDIAKPLMAGVVAAWFTHFLREKAETKRKRKEWVATKIELTYGLICEALEHPGMEPSEAFERKLKLEKAINTIDLYADAKTKRVASEIAEAFVRGDAWIVYEPLLTALRDSFRESIGLEKLLAPVRALKFGYNPASAEK